MEAEVFAYEILDSGIKIWRCLSYDKQVTLPESMEGMPVTELAAYSFSAHMDVGQLEKLEKAGRLCYGTRDGERLCAEAEETKDRDGLPPELCGMKLEAITMPESLKRIGKYAFYNCDSLKTISFYSGISDLGAGLFTGCHHVKELAVMILEGRPSCLKEVLSELSEELRVDYWQNGEYARLLFPEFYEEGVENTPARILMTEVHGSGLPFRNCFKETRFQFAWYDERFDLARFQETKEFALELALNRLWHPLELSETAKAAYEAHVREQVNQAGAWILEHRNLQELSWLLETEAFFDLVTAELLEDLTKQAGKKQRPEVVSYLMDLKHRRFKPKAKSFDL